MWPAVPDHQRTLDIVKVSGCYRVISLLYKLLDKSVNAVEEFMDTLPIVAKLEFSHSVAAL